MKITIIFERFIVLMWKDLNFQLFCFCYSLLNVGSVFTEAQPGPTLTALCFEIAHSLLRNIVEREFQILTLMNFHEPLQIKCNFQRPSSSDLPLPVNCLVIHCMWNIEFTRQKTSNLRLCKLRFF